MVYNTIEKARLILRDKLIDNLGNIQERVVWAVPKSAKHPDGVRYRLAYIGKKKQSLVIYDNHHPKGHHKHFGRRQIPYDFITVGRLLEDFKKDIQEAQKHEDIRD